ncbi:hypothetical protein MAR_009970 [Mya arenaria]|uniref:Uncharacterized protein n=1 Tax=Mya arenaria TaxID=6604 RepID=A0ABY7E083_MYAAR|nr:hypothetical protein MAR_009970 [Mya arenaria]
MLVDWYTGTWTGTIVALFEVISISWVYGTYDNYPSTPHPSNITILSVFIQRISSLCRPTDTWGPCGDGMDCNYRTNIIKYSERTFWDLFYFNVFGRFQRTLP